MMTCPDPPWALYKTSVLCQYQGGDGILTIEVLIVKAQYRFVLKVMRTHEPTIENICIQSLPDRLAFLAELNFRCLIRFSLPAAQTAREDSTTGTITSNHSQH